MTRPSPMRQARIAGAQLVARARGEVVEERLDVAPVSVSFELDSLAETYCFATLRVQVRLPLDSVQAQALDCDEVARTVADALRCHVACPECRGVGRDHKLRCGRRGDAGLALSADRSER